MAEYPLLALAQRMKRGEPLGRIRDLRGSAYVARELPDDHLLLPSFDAVAEAQGRLTLPPSVRPINSTILTALMCWCSPMATDW